MRSSRPRPIKQILERLGVSLDAITVNRALLRLGYLENAEYISSTGSGEIKTYHRLTAIGLEYGENVPSRYSEKSEVRFYETRAPELLVKVVAQLAAEVDKLKPSGCP